MSKFTIAGFALVLLAIAPARAQFAANVPSRAVRQPAIRRQNYARQEAVRLLFGPQGLPALTRPSDPWNYQRSRSYGFQPNGYRPRYRSYYR